MDDIMHGLAGEYARGETRAKQLVTVGAGAAPACDVAERAGVIEANGRFADGENLRRIGIIGERLLDALHREPRVSPQIGILERIVPEPRGIVIAEPVAPVVAAAAILRGAALGLELAGIRAKPEIASADIDPIDRAAAVAIGAVEPSIEAPLETIDSMLLIAAA